MKNKTDWPSIIQLALSLLAALASWGFAFIFALGGVLDMVNSGPGSDQAVSYFMLAVGAGISGLLLLPSAGYAFLSLLRGPYPVLEGVESISRRFLRPTLLIFLLPVVLLAGYLVSKIPQLAWLILPLLHVLAVGLPVLWLGYLGWRGLASGSNQRAWGIFGTGLILGPSFILVFELTALAVIFLIGIVYIGLNPDLRQELQVLVFRLRVSGQSPEVILRLITPYLAHPLVLFAIFAFVAGIVPLIEETFKPIGAWLLVGTNITPWEGFAAGLLSGAGYAFFENLALSTSAGGSWVEIVVTRIGTGLLHILTSGLSGWALALAWKEGRYLRLGATYLGAVLLHGMWNSLALLTGAENFSPAGAVKGVDFGQVSQVASIGLGALALAMLVILLASNSALRRAQERARLANPPGEPGDRAVEIPIAPEAEQILPQSPAEDHGSSEFDSQAHPANHGEK